MTPEEALLQEEELLPEEELALPTEEEAPVEPLSDEEKYWAVEEDPEELAHDCRERINDWVEIMKTSRFWADCTRNWRYYHNLYTGGKPTSSSMAIDSLGRDGQLKQMSVNHFRELIGHILNLITQNRPSFQTEATRDDHDSLKNAQLGDAIVNDYLIDKKLEKRFKRAVEHAMVLQMGFIFCPWDWHVGDLVASDVNPLTGQPVPIRAGDFKFYSPSVYDVVWDFNNEDWDSLNWIMVRTWENKHDLSVHIDDQEQREEVLGLKMRDSENEDGANPGTREMMFFDIETEYSDLIPVWHFFHKDTDACPGGRMMKFTTNNIPIGSISELPYKTFPLFRIIPEEFLLTSLGYTKANDMQGCQEALNSEMSTILTNHTAAGVQAIWVPTGCELDEHMIGNGVLIVEGGQIPPQGINFAKTPREFFEFKKELSQSMEMISGINSVARGQPEPNLRTGEALKVLDSKAVQATNRLLGSYYECIEDVGTFILQHLPLFMQGQDERVVRMVGENNAAYAETFSRDGLANIANVRVEPGNALAKTVSGRLAIADRLLEHGFVRTQQEYITVLNTGELDPLIQADQSELDLIKDENKRLRRGMPAFADPTDYHVLHIREHKAVVNKVEVRENPDIVQVLYAHLMEHMSMLDQPAVARMQMALGFEVPYPPLPPDMAGPMPGGEGGGGGGGGGGAPAGVPPAAPGESAPGGEPGEQNFEAEQSNVGK